MSCDLANGRLEVCKDAVQVLMQFTSLTTEITLTLLTYLCINGDRYYFCSS
jgi:hypothetical protein